MVSPQAPAGKRCVCAKRPAERCPDGGERRAARSGRPRAQRRRPPARRPSLAACERGDLGGAGAQQRAQVGGCREGVGRLAAGAQRPRGERDAAALGDERRQLQRSRRRVERRQADEEVEVVGAGGADGDGGRGGGHAPQHAALDRSVPLDLLPLIVQDRCMIDNRRLRLLVEFERLGTVAGVADALSFAPSAVSQQLATLEREAGAPLFEHVGRRMLLTDVGRLLVAHGHEVLDAVERAEAELERAAATVAGTVRLATFQTVGMVLLPAALRILRARHPGVSVQYLEGEAEETLPLLAAGAIDLVVAEEYEHAPRVRDARHDRVGLCRDALVVALPRGHGLARRRRVPLELLAGEPWVSARADTAYAGMVAHACRTLGGFDPDVHHRANDVAVMMRLVAVGAVAILPSLGDPAADRALAVRAVGGQRLDREIFSVARATSAARPAIREVRRALADAVAELGLPAA